jgi:hypothetical protein
MTAGLGTTLAGAFRRAALPLGAYYVVTIALPVINGAAESSPGFVAHAIVVLAIPPLLILLAYAAVRTVHALARVALPAARK